MDEIKKNIIQNYVEAYNNFDIEKMLADLHRDIVFKNISNNEVNLTTTGISAFETQAEQAKNIFSRREQKITEIALNDNSAEVKIDYCGVLAIDLPNGLKAGDKIELEGKSIFRFEDEKIIEITDIS